MTPPPVLAWIARLLALPAFVLPLAMRVAELPALRTVGLLCFEGAFVERHRGRQGWEG
jgi:hypothetical protein